MEKAVKVRKAKVVLLAPNIASLVADGETDAGDGSQGGEAHRGTALATEHPAAALAALAAEREVPVVFALSRQRMGKVRRWDAHHMAAFVTHVMPPVPPRLPTRTPPGHPQLMGQRKRASAFAVLDANGVFDELRRLLQLAEQGRAEWTAVHSGGGGGGGPDPAPG